MFEGWRGVGKWRPVAAMLDLVSVQRNVKKNLRFKLEESMEERFLVLYDESQGLFFYWCKLLGVQIFFP